LTAPRERALVGPSTAGTLRDGEQDVVLVGWSTRALADAALRSGFRPRTVDFFGDLDQKRRVENLSLGRDLERAWSALLAAKVAASLPSAPLAYGFDLENHPQAVERLASGRELLGNPPSVLRAARDPAILFRVLREAGIPTPLTLFPGSGAATIGREMGARRRWLVKPLRGGGGRGVAELDPGRVQGADEMLQELIPGPVVGFSFLADGQRAQPLGLASQLEERAAFGAARFAYAGSLSCLPPGLDKAALREQALRAASAVTRAFGLRGWNGLDFIVRNGEVLPLEVNPRHTSSMELWDTAGARLFAAHVKACRGRIEWAEPPRPAEVRGKAVLFARRPVIVRESAGLLADLPAPMREARPAEDAGEAVERAAAPRTAAAVWPERPVADVPHPGERISAGRPVCSLYATGRTAPACVAALRALATRVERDLEADATDERATVPSDAAASPPL
jgi:predicted ATP-grasp superfamily ATP-dependent carboligase